METITKLALTLSELHNDIIMRLDIQFNTIKCHYVGYLVLGDNENITYSIFDDGRICITKKHI